MIRGVLAGGVGMWMLALGFAVPAWNAQARLPSDLFVQLEPHHPVPELSLRAAPGPGGNWRLRILAKAFVFTDVCVTVARPALIGHAHVYRDGRKVAGAYRPEVSLGQLGPGVHRFEVILRAQDHRVLAGPDGAIVARIEIRIPPHIKRPPEGGPA